MYRLWTLRGAGPPDRRASSTRVALATGFAVVFALWLLWGYQLGRSLQNVERSVSSVHEQYVRGEQTLSKVRTNVLLGSIYLRDALIDTRPAPRRYRASSPACARRSRSRSCIVPEVSSADRARPLGAAAGGVRRFLGVTRARSQRAAEDARSGGGDAAADASCRVETRCWVLDQLAEVQSESNARHEQEAKLFNQVRFRLIAICFGTLVGALSSP